jgi:hypothetical protein
MSAGGIEIWQQPAQTGQGHMHSRTCFDSYQTGVAKRSRRLAEKLVTDYYRIAPREWSAMPYEVKTLKTLESSEIVDTALAHTLCYSFKREAGHFVLAEGDLYRICLQDHRILDTASATNAKLAPLLTYVLTHELVHVVRFGQKLQRIDLPLELRGNEELYVERTTRNILSKAGDQEIIRLFSADAACSAFEMNADFARQ